jgi:hypothetical protein
MHLASGNVAEQSASADEQKHNSKNDGDDVTGAEGGSRLDEAQEAEEHKENERVRVHRVSVRSTSTEPIP